MNTLRKMLAIVVIVNCVISAFSQGSIVFNNNTGLVQLWYGAVPPPGGIVPMPKGGGLVQLFWAPTGTAYTPWDYSAPFVWEAANAGWKLENPVGFTTPAAGKFNGGILTLDPLPAGGTIDYVVIAWTGSASSFDAALAASDLAWVSQQFSSPTGNPTSIPPGVPVPLSASFQGMSFIPIPEPCLMALAGLGAATLLAFRRRK
jgi:hypothetical protein